MISQALLGSNSICSKINAFVAGYRLDRGQPVDSRGKASKSRGTAPKSHGLRVDRGIFEGIRSGTCFVWGLVRICKLWNFCLRGRLVELDPCSLFQLALV